MGINTAYYNRVAQVNSQQNKSAPIKEPKKNETSSSWKKPLLYTALAISVVAAGAFGAYQLGILPSLSNTTPSPSPTPPWKEKVEIPKQIRYQILAEKQRSSDLAQEIFEKPVLMLESGQPMNPKEYQGYPCPF